ncbi:glutamate racemase [Tissierella creatinini]|nr:glutamate racemase [Tissierella creatinini]TJX62539.1 glutamate racemase [Soehngenia saccharolytica]
MDRRIGVIDSGIGGLTVVKSIQQLIPGEDIIYFGDNINVPYGNRTKEEILALTMDMLYFMEKKNVKIVAIACNTISALIDDFKDKFTFPIIDIIHPTVEQIIKMDTYSLSILGTEFTINSKIYQKLLKERNPDISISVEGSRDLAALIDRGNFDSAEIKKIISIHINNLLTKGDVYNLVLACTHFPIVVNVFKEIIPEIKIIDPAFEQAKAIRTYLHDNHLEKKADKGLLEINTSGNTQVYESVIQKLKLKNVTTIKFTRIKQAV